MNNREITMPQTNIGLTFHLGARDQVARAFNYYNCIDRNASTEHIAEQLASHQAATKMFITKSAGQHAKFYAKLLRAKGMKHETYGIETLIDKLTDRHPIAVNMGVFYGKTAICSVESLHAILCPNPRLRVQALADSLHTEVRRFEQLVAGELEMLQLVNPHIDIGMRNFFISNIESENPLITFKPTPGR